MKRAAVYSRTSYYDKDGDNIDSQLEMCRQYAEENGYHVIGEFVDHNVSGADLDAPGLMRALSLARAGQFDVLVTRELDRFARSLVKQLTKESEFQEAGAGVEYVLGLYEDSLEGQLVKHVRAVIAEFTRGKIHERLTRGRVRAAERGNVFVAGNPPFGYDVAEAMNGGRMRRTLVINEEEAAWVRRIFEWYVFGDEENGPMSLVAIANRLTDLGLPTKWDKSRRGAARPIHDAGHWHFSSVGRIIRRQTYAGQWTFKETGHSITVPAIITPEMFERAQRQRVIATKGAKRRTRRDYLMRARLRCSGCGFGLVAHAVPNPRTGNQREYLYYTCGRTSRVKAKDRGACRRSRYSVGQIDSAVWSAIEALLTNTDQMEDVLEILRDEAAMQHISSQLTLAEKRVAESRVKLERLFDLQVEGQHSLDVFYSRQRRIELEIERREQERLDLMKQMTGRLERSDHLSSLQAFMQQIARGLHQDAATFEGRRRLIERLNVTATLETRDDLTRCAYIEVDGVLLPPVELPPAKPNRRADSI